MQMSHARDLRKLQQQWLQVCRSHIRTPGLKQAGMGATGQDLPFEAAFSNLAHAFLNEKAPGLQEYELGFQLVEKNEDNDRAVGVFGFKIGPSMIYAPVFFLHGELKGHELMYLKDSDTFVPMKENWVNYVLNRKPAILGESSTRNLRAMGIERPNLDQFRDSPSKYASAHEPWLLEGLPGLINAIEPVAAAQHMRTFEPKVPDLIKSSADMAYRLLQMVDVSPKLGRELVRFYGTELLKSAIDSARTLTGVRPLRPQLKPRRGSVGGSVWQDQEKQARDPRETGELRMISYDGTRPKNVTEKQAEELKRDGYLIDDKRDGASRAFRVQHPMTLMNPDNTGIYDVLCKPNDFQRCLVIHGPHGPRGSKPGCVLVSLDDKKQWLSTHPGKLFVENNDPSDDDYESWLDGLSDAESLEVGDTYVLLTPGRRGSMVFKVEKSLPSSGEGKQYEVWWRGEWDMQRPDNLPPVATSRYEYDNDDRDCQTISLGMKGGKKIVSRLGTVYFPPGTKKLLLKKAKGDSDSDSESPCCVEDDSRSEQAPLLPGSHIDLQLGILKMSSELKVKSNGSEAVVNGRRMTPKQALFSLVGDYGLRVGPAKQIMKQAATRAGARYRIKSAAPYMLQQEAPGGPTIPDPEVGGDQFFGSGLPTTYSREDEYPVQGMYRGNREDYNPSRPPDQQTIQQVIQAAQTGQREVLDTSMLSTLLKGSREDTLVDQHLSDLVKGLDRLGRLLFNLYWHRDMFEERYGADAIPELEDMLRNSFDSLGDVTLELKQKTIEPSPLGQTEVDTAAMAEV